MSGIKFEQEEVTLQKMRQTRQSRKTTALGRFFIELSGGRIKNQQQANKVLVIITIILFTYSAYLLITRILT
jgi:hypothetical protein